MSVVFIDGADHLVTADLPKKYDTVSGAVISSSPIRGTGVGGALRFTSNEFYVRKMGLPAHTTYIICGAYYFQAWPVDWQIATFYETSAQAQLCVRIGSGVSNFQVYRGNESVGIGGAVASGMVLNNWYFIETKLICHASAGTITVRVNGAVVVNFTAQNTQGGATALVNGFGLGSPYPGGGSFGGVNVDDVFVLNGAGTENNDYIGDRRVATLMPNADGQYSEFARTGGSAAGNYTAVSEVAPDGDTSYVASNTVGQRDLYAVPALPANAVAVSAVQWNIVAAKTDAVSARTLQPLHRTGTTDAVGTATEDLTLPYKDQVVLSERSLVSTAPWTVAELAASQLGVKVAS